METHDSLSYDCFEAGSIDGVLLDYGVDCTEDQKLRKDTEFVRIARSVASEVSRGVVVVYRPLVGSGCDDLGGFYMSC